ncbi:hypothetical protein FSB78_09075 [Sphingomonas ginsenosidivorax]|uniref:SMP-30/Gluconolactonase/LRE-like region domain-containing protein n=1 Tax=Sphingomonas ginsenosidivorax TaxID=862135 RepID=A0A5C6UFZ7_9SPHN|nr:hypothetical protein [Sphingomonas ginsenosidivorax]TXC71086.1 hypothetical protein FSB78_09075 [Sphingomonas ginsenosidivorax]
MALSLVAVSAAMALTARDMRAQTSPPSPPSPPSPICGTEGGAQLLCGVSKPEDLFRVEGTDWIVTTSLAGGIHILNTRDKRPVPLYPAANARETFDRRTYASCAGPPDAAAKAHFSTLGLHIRPLGRGLHRLYVTRYPGPSGVDVFDLDVRAKPRATWIGCVPSPGTVLANSIVGLRDGGFIVSSFYETGANSQASRAKALDGGITGALWSWHPKTGWAQIPGTESAGPNGIELSPDGRHAYVNQWGSRTFMRVTLGAVPPRRDIVPMGFRPDNLHWAPDGMLLIAGHTDTAGYLAKIDPVSLKVTPLLSRPDTPRFVHVSGAIQIGSDYWVGSSRSDHLAIFPALDKR